MIDAEIFFARLLPHIVPEGSVVDEPARIADAFLQSLSSPHNAGDSDYQELPAPFKDARTLLYREFQRACSSDRKEAFESLFTMLESSSPKNDTSLADAIWKAFFPEALYLDENPEKQILLLRDKRRVRIVRKKDTALSNPAAQVLFTSNVLLSPPGASQLEDSENSESGNNSDRRDIVLSASEASREKQLYWYDHPVPIGSPVENDEVLYGLAGLAEALAFEKTRSVADRESRLSVVLSVSVTHAGLHRWARPWLRAQLASSAMSLDGLDVYAFTEDDCSAIVDILSPWIEREEEKPGEPYGENDNSASERALENLRETFGVDGEYGRHYSFLKAIAALWSVLADPEIKATFKIDLDQRFPEKELCAETGRSAFEHFTTPLWGAQAQDVDGKPVELGMIAGALVNEKDISGGIFTPDIPWPGSLPEGENLLFYKLRPMAVSTRAEMMTRYGYQDGPDGRSTALQRFHVTGGTNGILLDSLRRYRPFTPGFVGRAEDQAYLLSVLHSDSDTPALRYLHADGLIMRHDKEAFAGEAVEAGKLGSYVGDLLRLFIFSSYADLLPGGAGPIKKDVDPFTGSFITPMPATLALLRLALHLRDENNGTPETRMKLLELAGERLGPWIRDGEKNSEHMKRRLNREKQAWNRYYNALDKLEGGLKKHDAAALGARKAFLGLLQNCRITG